MYGYKEIDKYEIGTDMNTILFVSAGRPEKNLVRTILALNKFVNESGNTSLKLKCVGIDAKEKEHIRQRLGLDPQFFDKHVEFLGYVQLDELNRLYSSCRFLAFTSKSEGFGLPVLEALLHNKPVLASNRSSIPEVVGACAVYVNPFDEKSICEGLHRLMDDSSYNYYIKMIMRKKKQILDRISLDTELLVHEILG